MKSSRKLLIILLFLLAFAAGLAGGALFQRYVGLGDFLRSAGYPYPTRPPLPTPTPIRSAEIPVDQQGELALFILAGQSNMSGVGPIPPEAAGPMPQVYLFGNDYRWHIAREPIDDPAGQVDTISLDGTAGISPGMAFAAALRELDPSRPIGLVPCAKGFSSIIQWQPDRSDNSLYGSCLKRAQAASTMGEVVGLLFFQGESDALDPAQYSQVDPRPEEWAGRFTQMVARFRADLRRPDIPVVFAQIGSHTAPDAFIAWETVQTQQASVQFPGVAMIRTADLALLDGVHYTAESYREIGRRFAQAYWQLHLDAAND